MRVQRVMRRQMYDSLHKRPQYNETAKKKSEEDSQFKELMEKLKEKKRLLEKKKRFLEEMRLLEEMRPAKAHAASN